MGIVTQIGSLPYENVSEAVTYSLKHDIPFLPELPKLGDAMLKYIKSPGELSCLEEFKKHEFSTVEIQYWPCNPCDERVYPGWGSAEGI